MGGYLPASEAVTRAQASEAAASSEVAGVTTDDGPVTPADTGAVTPDEAVTGVVTDES